MGAWARKLRAAARRPLVVPTGIFAGPDKSCKGKVRHETRGPAASTALRMRVQTGDLELVAYQCRWCKGWHVGHDKRDEAA